MEAHNQLCPNLGWMGLVGEQIIWEMGFRHAQFVGGSLSRISVFWRDDAPSLDRRREFQPCQGI
jgi:hypothetical protein